MTETVVETVPVELTAQELLDISVACAWLAERGVPDNRERFKALALKVIVATADSEIDIDTLRRELREPPAAPR